MKFATFLLEERLREHYDDTEIILCLSGVEDYSFGEIRGLTGISSRDLDRIVMLDSPREGDPKLRRAIAQRWGKGDPDRVLVTHGSTEAMFLAMNALLQPDDEVIVTMPCYQPLASIPEAIGCRVVPWRLRGEEGFVPDLDNLRSLISPSTRMIVVNFPHNPTGVTLTHDQQEQLIGAAAEAGSYLVWDAAFAELTYDSPPLPDPGENYDRAITLGTFSKAYGLGGLRIGWCLANPEVLRACIRMRGYLTVNLSPLVEFIAQRIVDKVDAIVAERLGQARRNLALLSAWMDQHREAVEWVRPQGGVTAFPRLLTVEDIDGFCRQLATERDVLLLPGSCFEQPQNVRLGFGGSTTDLEEGLARLSKFLPDRQAGAG